MFAAVLTRRAEAPAVGENGLEFVEIGAAHVETLVYDEAREMLADAMPHNARFAVVDMEAFFQQNRGGAMAESLGATREGAIAGKGKIIGVARVDGSGSGG